MYCMSPAVLASKTAAIFSCKFGVEIQAVSAVCCAPGMDHKMAVVKDQHKNLTL